MPSESSFKRPAYNIWLCGPAGSGKTVAALSFPRICAITYDPTGLDVIYDPESRASEFAKNLVWRIPLNGTPWPQLFKFKEQADETSLYGAIQTAIQLRRENKIDTMLLEGYTYLATDWYNHIFSSEDEIITTRSGAMDHQKMWGRLSQRLSQFTLGTLSPLAVRHQMNVIVTVHVQRESENTVKGMDDPKNQEASKASKRLVNLESDMAPQILGGFRQQVDGMPSAMIYLNHYQGQDDKGQTIEKHVAYCRQMYVKELDTVVKAKNRYGLPASMDITGKSLYGILMHYLQKSEKARVAAAAPQPVPAASAATTAKAEHTAKENSK